MTDHHRPPCQKNATRAETGGAYKIRRSDYISLLALLPLILAYLLAYLLCDTSLHTGPS